MRVQSSTPRGGTTLDLHVTTLDPPIRYESNLTSGPCLGEGCTLPRRYRPGWWYCEDGHFQCAPSPSIPLAPCHALQSPLFIHSTGAAYRRRCRWADTTSPSPCRQRKATPYSQRKHSRPGYYLQRPLPPLKPFRRSRRSQRITTTVTYLSSARRASTAPPVPMRVSLSAWRRARSCSAREARSSAIVRTAYWSG